VLQTLCSRSVMFRPLRYADIWSQPTKLHTVLSVVTKYLHTATDETSQSGNINKINDALNFAHGVWFGVVFKRV